MTYTTLRGQQMTRSDDISVLQDLFFIAIGATCEFCGAEFEAQDIEHLRFDDTIEWSTIAADRAEKQGWGVKNDQIACAKCL